MLQHCTAGGQLERSQQIVPKLHASLRTVLRQQRGALLQALVLNRQVPAEERAEAAGEPLHCE